MRLDVSGTDGVDADSLLGESYGFLAKCPPSQLKQMMTHNLSYITEIMTEGKERRKRLTVRVIPTMACFPAAYAVAVGTNEEPTRPSMEAVLIMTPRPRRGPAFLSEFGAHQPPLCQPHFHLLALSLSLARAGGGGAFGLTLAAASG